MGDNDMFRTLISALFAFIALALSAVADSYVVGEHRLTTMTMADGVSYWVLAEQPPLDCGSATDFDGLCISWPQHHCLPAMELVGEDGLPGWSLVGGQSWRLVDEHAMRASEASAQTWRAERGFSIAPVPGYTFQVYERTFVHEIDGMVEEAVHQRVFVQDHRNGPEPMLWGDCTQSVQIEPREPTAAELGLN